MLNFQANPFWKAYGRKIQIAVPSQLNRLRFSSRFAFAAARAHHIQITNSWVVVFMGPYFAKGLSYSCNLLFYAALDCKQGFGEDHIVTSSHMMFYKLPLFIWQALQPYFVWILHFWKMISDLGKKLALGCFNLHPPTSILVPEEGLELT